MPDFIIPTCRLRHVSLVCRRFREACQEPTTWSDLHLAWEYFTTQAGWQHFLHWLAVRGSKLHSFAMVLENTTVRFL